MNDTPGYVKNLKKESVVQSVINCLTDAMRNKELKPGDRIPPEPEYVRPSKSSPTSACWRASVQRGPLFAAASRRA